jgi:hypothetical protein
MNPVHAILRARFRGGLASRFFLGACVLALAWSAFAEPLRLPTAGNRIDVTASMKYFLEDSEEELTFEEALERFEAGDAKWVNTTQLSLGPRDGVVWGKLEIVNPTDETTFALEINNPRLSFVDYYFGEDALRLRVFQLGAARPPENRPFRSITPTARFKLAQGETQTVYVRVENVGDMRFSVRLWTEQDFWVHVNNLNRMTLIMVGALVALWLSQLVVFVSLREAGYFYLSLFLLSWLFCYLAITGYGSLLVWGNSALIGERAPTIGSYMMCASFLIFANKLLDIPKHSAVLSRLAMSVAVASLGGIVFTLTFDSIWRIYFDLLIVAATPILAVAMGLQALRRGNRSAGLFLVVWCMIHVGGISLLLLRAYLLTDHWLGAILVNMLLLGSVLAWSLDLTGRVRVRMRQKQQALEAEVAERTTALVKAETKLKDLSELLPICAHCKNIRDDQGYWSSVESYISKHTDVNLTHGLCPSCVEELYPEIAKSMRDKGKGEPA